MADGGADPGAAPGAYVYVSGLPYEASASDLREAFARKGIDAPVRGGRGVLASFQAGGAGRASGEA
jgi:hypothetical protein